jgi:putative FmdB family regulatory protein
MPTYEYECRSCGHTFEAFQSINDKPLSRCPKCKSAVRRIINGGMGVIFKGSGFYSTDNKKGSVLTGGNGGSKEKSREGSSEKSTSDTSSTGKSSSEKSSSDKSSASSASKEKSAAS